ncbi:hypothetical protein P9209_22060 [Prescottella defluvii]|nr:hypothetical protein P9209_22060 [Prescottella defluvii]
MRAFTKSAVVAVAATIACTLPMGVAAAQASPFGSLGSLGSSDPGTENPGTENPVPQVTVPKSTDIAAAGENITISGTGFDGAAAGTGLYVGVIQDDKWSPPTRAPGAHRPSSARPRSSAARGAPR